MDQKLPHDGRPVRPLRPPTHRSLDFSRLAKLASELEEVASDGLVSAADVDELAADLGAPREQLYAALTVSDDVALRIETADQVLVCAGGCQPRLRMLTSTTMSNATAPKRAAAIPASNRNSARYQRSPALEPITRSNQR